MAIFDDERGLASGVLLFVAMLIVGGLLFIAFNTAAGDLFTVAGDYTTNTDAQDHIDLMEQMWDGILVFIAFLAVLMLIARAVFESRRA